VSIEALSPRLRYLVAFDDGQVRALAAFADQYEAERYAELHAVRTVAPRRLYAVVDLDEDPSFTRGFVATLRRPA
jgi:hypothetical protein